MLGNVVLLAQSLHAFHHAVINAVALSIYLVTCECIVFSQVSIVNLLQEHVLGVDMRFRRKPLLVSLCALLGNLFQGILVLQRGTQPLNF